MFNVIIDQVKKNSQLVDYSNSGKRMIADVQCYCWEPILVEGHQNTKILIVPEFISGVP